MYIIAFDNRRHRRTRKKTAAEKIIITKIKRSRQKFLLYISDIRGVSWETIKKSKKKSEISKIIVYQWVYIGIMMEKNGKKLNRVTKE